MASTVHASAQIDADYADVTEDRNSVSAFKDDLTGALTRNLYQKEPDMMEVNGKPCFACVLVSGCGGAACRHSN